MNTDPHTVKPAAPAQPVTQVAADTIVLAPILQPEEKRLLLEWTAPSRPFKKRDKDFFTTVTTMAVLFIVILFFMKEFLVILVVIAFVFLVYVLSTVPPEPIQNQIYTTGITNGAHFYPWQDLSYYTFDYKWGQPMMVVRTRPALPGAIYMLLGDIQREKIEEIIGNRLILRDAPDSYWMDRTATWLSKKVPLEKQPE